MLKHRYLIRCVEALTRAGEFEKPLLRRAVAMFEVRCHFFLAYNAFECDFLLTHIGLFGLFEPCRTVHGRDI